MLLIWFISSIESVCFNCFVSNSLYIFCENWSHLLFNSLNCLLNCKELIISLNFLFTLSEHSFWVLIIKLLNLFSSFSKYSLSTHSQFLFFKLYSFSLINCSLFLSSFSFIFSSLSIFFNLTYLSIKMFSENCFDFSAISFISFISFSLWNFWSFLNSSNVFLIEFIKLLKTTWFNL